MLKIQKLSDKEKLAKYLADYIEQEAAEHFRITGGSPDFEDWQGWIGAGLDAFESTENCIIETKQKI